jgi:hypothetical protein
MTYQIVERRDGATLWVDVDRPRGQVRYLVTSNHNGIAYQSNSPATHTNKRQAWADHSLEVDGVHAWTQWSPTTLFYVAQLKGEGGKDWGYTTDRHKARLLSPYWAKRFMADCRYCNRPEPMSGLIPQD